MTQVLEAARWIQHPADPNACPGLPNDERIKTLIVRKPRKLPCSLTLSNLLSIESAPTTHL